MDEELLNLRGQARETATGEGGKGPLILRPTCSALSSENGGRLPEMLFPVPPGCKPLEQVLQNLTVTPSLARR